jgi:hypothetical protein
VGRGTELGGGRVMARHVEKLQESEGQWRESAGGARSIARDLSSRSSYPLPHGRELERDMSEPQHSGNVSYLDVNVYRVEECLC